MLTPHLDKIHLFADNLFYIAITSEPMLPMDSVLLNMDKFYIFDECNTQESHTQELNILIRIVYQACFTLAGF